MNRRDFLKMVGAAGVVNVVGISAAWSSTEVVQTGDLRFRLADWPSMEVKWVEEWGDIKPLQPGHPNYFDYTNYVDTDPFKDEEPYIDW